MHIITFRLYFARLFSFNLYHAHSNYKGEGILARGLQECRTGESPTGTHSDFARSDGATIAKTNFESHLPKALEKESAVSDSCCLGGFPFVDKKRKRNIITGTVM